MLTVIIWLCGYCFLLSSSWLICLGKKIYFCKTDKSYTKTFNIVGSFYIVRWPSEELLWVWKIRYILWFSLPQPHLLGQQYHDKDEVFLTDASAFQTVPFPCSLRNQQIPASWVPEGWRTGMVTSGWDYPGPSE